MINTNWYEVYPERYHLDKKLVREQYPLLRFAIKDGIVWVYGEIEIFDVTGKECLTNYSVEIKYPNNYPHSLPLVYETGDKIPKEDKWHVSKNGSLCVFLPEAVNFQLDQDKTIVDFIDAAYSFLVSHFVKVHTGKYPAGEWAHGEQARINYFMNELCVNSFDSLCKLLFQMVGQKKVIAGVNDQCPCGKREKYKRCHMQALSRLKGRTSKEAITSTLQLLFDKHIPKKDQVLL